MYSVRRGVKDDVPGVLELIKELAEYEKAAHKVEATVQQMEGDGFGPKPLFEFFVAAEDSTGKLVGLALYFYSYSTWKGRALYLEDLVVTKACRGTGLGKRLFDQIMQQAQESGSKRVVWQVLDWNAPAIGFYEMLGAEIPKEWLTCHLHEEQIKQWKPIA